MTRARTLVTVRRLMQGACYRALLAGADALVEFARRLGPAGAAPAARPVEQPAGRGWPKAERLRLAATRVLVEALLARQLSDGESSLRLAFAIARELRRGGPRHPVPAVASIREMALRGLVEALLRRPLRDDEDDVQWAMQLSDHVRRRHPMISPEHAARLTGGDDAVRG